MDLSPFLEFALHAAHLAGRSTLAHFQTGVAVERKADLSPVTVADRGAERILRELIADRFPDHLVLGEEFGETGAASGSGASGPSPPLRPAASRFRWVLDPIDGTQSFVRGVPLYGVLVGLEIDGSPVVGVAEFPALNETVAAARGEGCYWNGRRARVSGVERLEDAAVGYSDSRSLGARMGERWLELQRATRVQRGWGDCYGHALVATGRLDVMLDAAMNPWDCAALIPILIEAGGTFTDWRGETRIDGGDAVSTNGPLAASVGRILREC